MKQRYQVNFIGHFSLVIFLVQAISKSEAVRIATNEASLMGYDNIKITKIEVK